MWKLLLLATLLISTYGEKLESKETNWASVEVAEAEKPAPHHITSAELERHAARKSLAGEPNAPHSHALHHPELQPHRQGIGHYNVDRTFVRSNYIGGPIARNGESPYQIEGRRGYGRLLLDGVPGITPAGGLIAPGARPGPDPAGRPAGEPADDRGSPEHPGQPGPGAIHYGTQVGSAYFNQPEIRPGIYERTSYRSTYLGQPAMGPHLQPYSGANMRSGYGSGYYGRRTQSYGTPNTRIGQERFGILLGGGSNFGLTGLRQLERTRYDYSTGIGSQGLTGSSFSSGNAIGTGQLGYSGIADGTRLGANGIRREDHSVSSFNSGHGFGGAGLTGTITGARPGIGGKGVNERSFYSRSGFGTGQAGRVPGVVPSVAGIGQTGSFHGPSIGSRRSFGSGNGAGTGVHRVGVGEHSSVSYGSGTGFRRTSGPRGTSFPGIAPISSGPGLGIGVAGRSFGPVGVGSFYGSGPQGQSGFAPAARTGVYGTAFGIENRARSEGGVRTGAKPGDGPVAGAGIGRTIGSGRMGQSGFSLGATRGSSGSSVTSFDRAYGTDFGTGTGSFYGTRTGSVRYGHTGTLGGYGPGLRGGNIDAINENLLSHNRGNFGVSGGRTHFSGVSRTQQGMMEQPRSIQDLSIGIGSGFDGGIPALHSPGSPPQAGDRSSFDRSYYRSTFFGQPAMRPQSYSDGNIRTISSVYETRPAIGSGYGAKSTVGTQGIQTSRFGQSQYFTGSPAGSTRMHGSRSGTVWQDGNGWTAIRSSHFGQPSLGFSYGGSRSSSGAAEPLHHGRSLAYDGDIVVAPHRMEGVKSIHRQPYLEQASAA